MQPEIKKKKRLKDNKWNSSPIMWIAHGVARLSTSQIKSRECIVYINKIVNQSKKKIYQNLKI